MAGQTETLIETILQWIDIGRLNPGDVVDETALVAEFGVSRTPVREAVLQLEAMGLVRRLPRKEFDTTVDVWLAPSQGHLPVRMRITQANGDVADQRLITP